MDQLRIKLLRLRALRRKSSFITSVDGDFTQKFTIRANETSKRVVSEVKNDLASSNWKLVPRGKVAVRMSFFAKDSQVPSVHNLVKYYLDLLNGLFFSDDRQVHYLEAYCYKTDSEESKLYLEVERFISYKQKLELYFEFKDQFVSDSGFDENWESHKELFPLLDKAGQQSLILEGNRIDLFDRPGSQIKAVADWIRKYQSTHPYIIDLGDLPSKSGESKEYRKRIRDTLKALTERSNVFNPIVIPIELDVQVTPRAIKLGKDLDNIMIDICGPFIEEAMGADAYINAYRIYVTDKLATDTSGGIRIKFLPFGAIQEFRTSVVDVLNKAEEYLEEKDFYN